MAVKSIIFSLIGQLFWFSLVLAAPGELADGTPPGNNTNPHNLSSQSGNAIKADSETRICIFCHTPHGATPQSTLWSRPDPANMGSFATFDVARTKDPSGNFAIDNAGIAGTTLYGNNTTPNEYPNGASKLCLSCHDGITAIGVLADGTAISINGSTATTMDSASSTMTFSTGKMDMTRTHPISFVYNQAVVDYINLAGTNKDDVYKLPAPGSRIKTDSQFRVQCTVCHEPHFDTKGQGHTYPFWRNAGVGADDTADFDQTCLECHTPVRTNTGHNI